MTEENVPCLSCARRDSALDTLKLELEIAHDNAKAAIFQAEEEATRHAETRTALERERERSAELLLRAEEPIDKWPFHVLLRAAKEILSTYYPEGHFPANGRDPGPRFVADLRRLIRELDAHGKNAPG